MKRTIFKSNLFFRAMDAKPEFTVLQQKNDKNEVIAEIVDGDFVAYKLSSEMPYERVFRCGVDANGEPIFEKGLEVLCHSPECIDMSRMINGAPFLDQHDPKVQLGIIKKFELTDTKETKIGVQFSKNPLPQERLRDIKDGIRPKCSVGYSVKTYMREEPKDENSLPIYRAVAWTPYEGSSVSIAADDSVGAGRSEVLEFETEVLSKEVEKPKTPEIQVKSNEKEKQKMKLTAPQILEIRELGKGHGFTPDEVMDFVTKDESTIEGFKEMCLKKNHAAPVQKEVGLGLSDKEVKRYSLANVLRAFSEPNTSKKDIGFELELSQELQRQNAGVAPRTIYVPFDVFTAPQQRVGLNTTAATGGFTIQQNVLANEFIDVLRPEARVIQAGARVMSGLVGNVLIPKLSAASQCAWVGEDTANSESDQTFAGPTLSPKTLSGWTKIGRQLLIQSSNNIESIVRTDLTRIFGLAVDKAALFGLGASYQPKGIIKMTAPLASQLNWTTTATPSWANVVALESVVTGADALISDKGAYITNATMIGKMKVTAKAGSYPVFIYEKGMVNEYPCLRSNQFATTYATTAMFGDWDQMIIGQWGNGINMLVDPYTYSDTGALKVTALMFADIQVRHEESFAIISDSTFSA